MEQVWLEPIAYQLRLIEGEPKDKPAPLVTGLVECHGETAVLRGFGAVGNGQLTRERVMMIGRALRARGFRFAIAERTGRHRLPFGRVIEGGVFAGRWRVDLEQFDG
jgi:hypothetical protein